MQDLRSCPSCRRHHRAQDTSCPFCGRARRVSAVVPVLAVLGLTACPGPVRSVYAGPPPDRDPVQDDLIEDVDASDPEAGGEAVDPATPIEPAVDDVEAADAAQDEEADAD